MRRGFTLIEVVVSLSILVLISSFFFYFFKTGIETQKYSRDYFAALNLAQQTIEEIKSASFEALTSRIFAGNNGQITVKNINSDLREITLTLIWNPKRHPIELYTLRAR
jgi:prepilin-type N-terminal cleavage/methylation domain-containing protein